MKPQIVMIIPLGEAPAGPGGPNYPSQGPGFPTQLPMPGGPGQPAYPSQGPGFPTPPIAPGGHPGSPNVPSQGLPTPPVDPSWGVTPPVDPGYGRPDISEGRPDNTLPLPPESTAPPGQIYPPITELHTKTVMLTWLPGYGYRWVVVDPSLQPGHDLPVPPNQPAQPQPHQGRPVRR